MAATFLANMQKQNRNHGLKLANVDYILTWKVK